MRWSRVWTPTASLAALGLAGAVALVGLAAVRATRLEPLPAPAPSTPANPEEPIGGSVFASARDVVRRAVARDPFRPERRPSDTRFRMPGDAVAGEKPSPPSEQDAALKLIGTAVMGAGKGFAMCQSGAQPPRVVRIGESFAGYTLSAIDRGRAVFRDPRGRVLELKAPKVGS